jgi:hypothetical protein
MFEGVAIAVGLMLGVAMRHISAPRMRATVLIVLSLVAGSAVSAAAGELEISFGFLVFDCGQVLVAALAGAWAAEVIDRRRAQA